MTTTPTEHEENEMPTFPEGATVRFTEKRVAEVASSPDHAEYLRGLRLTVQNEPSPRRVNVKYFAYPSATVESYRTFAAKDLALA